jgi:hypothetical protein
MTHKVGAGQWISPAPVGKCQAVMCFTAHMTASSILVFASASSRLLPRLERKSWNARPSSLIFLHRGLFLVAEHAVGMAHHVVDRALSLVLGTVCVVIIFP